MGGRLAQRNVHGVKGTDTITFIYKGEVPSNKKVTYVSFTCDFRPLKEEQHRVRITVGVDKLDYYDDTGSPANNLLETKILIDSVISSAKKGSRFMSADTNDHFLETPIRDPEHMEVKCKHLPEDIRKRHNLDKMKTSDDYIYIKIQKGMPGLKQVAMLVCQNLKNFLEPCGHKQCLE